MDGDVNVTYVTLGGYVEVEKYWYVYFVIIFLLYILIICCNATIVYLIVIHQNLHEPMYIFIAALLINSVLFSTNIYPKLLIDSVSKKQTIIYQACLFQAVVYYILVYSEFLLLSAMSYDRYVSICKPLLYSAIMKKSTVTVFLVVAWLVPTCGVIGAVVLNRNIKLCSFTLKGIFCNNSVYSLQCVRTKALSIYGIILLLNLAFLPVLFIIFTYTQIIMGAYRSSRDFRKKAAQTCLPHLMVLLNFSCFITYDVTIVRVESNIPKTVGLVMTFQVILYHPLFNPIMYGLKMKEINKHLTGLFSQIKSY